MSYYYLICAVVFALAFLVNMTYITVFYHRALAHGALRLKPWLRRFVAYTGVWVTGIDPKSWCCMHRLHHRHSDTADDPHSPQFVGIIGVLIAQLRSYEKVIAGLLAGQSKYETVVKDLDFRVSWSTRKNLWLAPYALHAGIGLAIGLASGAWLLVAAYWLGMLTHPLQGWLVNAFAHRYGYRNFATGDNSRNNTLVAWLVMGEGYQNNHHRHPRSAKFSARWWEVDMGYGLCQLVELCGLAKIDRRNDLGEWAERQRATNATSPAHAS